MRLPKQNELIQVFSDRCVDGKIRYFKKYSLDSGTPICVYADGETKETNKGDVEYWETWCYPSELPNYKNEILKKDEKRKKELNVKKWRNEVYNLAYDFLIIKECPNCRYPYVSGWICSNCGYDTGGD